MVPYIKHVIEWLPSSEFIFSKTHKPTMPYIPYWQLLSDFLFIKFEPLGFGSPEDHIPCLYDDPHVNEQLGIKRIAGTYNREDAPTSMAGQRAKPFCSYVSAAVNAMPGKSTAGAGMHS